MSTAKTYFSAFALIVACAVIGFALWHLAGLSRVEAALVLACLLLGAAQIITLMTRDLRQDRTIAQVHDLALASTQTIRELDSLKQKVADVEQAAVEASHSKNQELASQFQVLETLVKQMAERIATAQVAATDGKPPAAPVNGGGAQAHDGDGGGSDAQLLDMVRRSLEENRVDLYLQPIVMLPQRKTCYYEALTRLRDSSGDVIMPASYLRVAEPAGIMPMIDNLLLFRCVKVMRRLVERNREIGVFCNISANSLLDPEFFPHFLEFMQQNRELAGSLIFEFSQATVNGAGPLEQESMSLLSEIGFRFSLDHVTDLNIDFHLLSEQGFRFLKVDAHTLIDGMAGAGAQIHSADLKALLGRYGIELVAEKVETERDVVNLLDFEVGLGQGYLFSEPRLVREEIIEARRPQSSRAV
ncbi:MAG: EAL domain-containing protein [Hyphomicrobiales bacterium]